jgi:AcrR family transcriptional regulator
VNKQLIFHYFRSKDRLYAAAVKAALAPSPRAHSAAGGPPDALRASVSEFLSLLTPGGLALSVLADASVPGGSTESARTSVSQWLKHTHWLLKVAIIEGQRLGFFRDDIWPDTASKLIMDQCIGASMSRSALGLAGVTDAHRVSDSSTAIGDWAVEYCAWQ